MTESHNAPPKATLSNGAARPLHPQAQYPMASTGSSYIKSKWCHLSSWFICPNLRPRKSSKESSSCVRLESNSAKESCCLHDRKRNARLQDNATHAKPGCCETKSFFVRWKAWKDPRNDTGHSAPLQHVAFSNCAAHPLVGAQWMKKASCPIGATGETSYGFNRNEPKPFHLIVFSCLQPVGKNKSEQDTITFNVLYIYVCIYTHIISYMECIMYTYIYICVCVCKIRQSVVAKRSICMLVSGMASCSCQDPIWPCGLGVFCHIYPRMPCVFW